MLSHIAARTDTIRLFTGVTTLSLLDPVLAFEDYATLDHLSDGQLELLRQPEAKTPAYDRIVDDVLDLISGRYLSAEGVEVHAVPGEGAGVQPWVLGSSGADSAVVAVNAGCASRRTATSARERCSTRWRPTGRRSGRRSSWTGRT